MRHRALAVIAAILLLFTSQARGQQPVHRVRVLSNAQIPENIQAWETTLTATMSWDGISPRPWHHCQLEPRCVRKWRKTTILSVRNHTILGRSFPPRNCRPASAGNTAPIYTLAGILVIDLTG